MLLKRMQGFIRMRIYICKLLFVFNGSRKWRRKTITNEDFVGGRESKLWGNIPHVNGSHSHRRRSTCCLIPVDLKVKLRMTTNHRRNVVSWGHDNSKISKLLRDYDVNVLNELPPFAET